MRWSGAASRAESRSGRALGLAVRRMMPDDRSIGAQNGRDLEASCGVPPLHATASPRADRRGLPKETQSICGSWPSPADFRSNRRLSHGASRFRTPNSSHRGHRWIALGTSGLEAMLLRTRADGWRHRADPLATAAMMEPTYAWQRAWAGEGRGRLRRPHACTRRTRGPARDHLASAAGRWRPPQLGTVDARASRRPAGLRSRWTTVCTGLSGWSLRITVSAPSRP